MSAPADPDRLLDLPPMAPVVATLQVVQRHLGEIAFEATVIEVLLRGESRARHRDAPPTLKAARDALAGGAVDGVQVRYVHEQIEWADTIMRTEAGFRVVRVRK